MASPGSKQPTHRNGSSGRTEQAPQLPSIQSQLTGSHGANEPFDQPLGVDSEDNFIVRSRSFLRWFLPSKYGHYFVIILVSLDISCIFADCLVSLHICEHRTQRGFDEKAGLQRRKSWVRSVWFSRGSPWWSCSPACSRSDFGGSLETNGNHADSAQLLEVSLSRPRRDRHHGIFRRRSSAS